MATEKIINIDGVVKEVNLVERISAKTERPYTAIQVLLDNGYELLMFPDRAVKYMIDQLVKDTNK